MSNRNLRQSGFSLLELLAGLLLIGIISSTAISNLNALKNPLTNTGHLVSHYLRLVRSRAISQTLAIEVSPESNSRLVAKSTSSCSGSMSPIDDLSLDFQDGVTLEDTDWTVCFNQRGLADSYITFTIESAQGSKTIQVALGGGVKIE